MSQKTRLSSGEIVGMLPKLTRAVTDTLKECPDGTPASALFEPFEAQGVSRHTFDKFMMALKRSDLALEKDGIYFPGKKARPLLH